MKAILLAGGTGTRLRPATVGINKHLIPVYNKPMIYYSISVLMLCKFKEIILICDPKSKKIYKEMFSNGKHLGMKIQIIVQKKANGIPEAFFKYKPSFSCFAELVFNYPGSMIKIIYIFLN